MTTWIVDDGEYPAPTVGLCPCSIVTTSTTTTTAPCENPDCETDMEVEGVDRETGPFGYASGEQGYGTLDPNCADVLLLNWYDNYLNLYTTECYTSVTVQIDGQSFEMTLEGKGEGYYYWYYTPTENPFGYIGNHVTVRICGVECTTTTTTTTVAPTTTTTTTVQG